MTDNPNHVEQPNQLVFNISKRLVLALNNELGIAIHDDPANMDIQPHSFTHDVAMKKYNADDKRVLKVCTSVDNDKARLFIGWVGGKKLFDGLFRDAAHFETWLVFILGVFVTSGIPITNKTKTIL